jgi:hypothetical protein
MWTVNTTGINKTVRQTTRPAPSIFHLFMEGKKFQFREIQFIQIPITKTPGFGFLLIKGLVSFNARSTKKKLPFY